MSLIFKQIINSRDAYFTPAMNIYYESFPSNERHSIDIIKNRIIEKKSKLSNLIQFGSSPKKGTLETV